MWFNATVVPDCHSTPKTLQTLRSSTQLYTVLHLPGDAIINGLSVKNDMTAIRQDLGVCPQFDILWPEITVKEHLMLYAAIKGFTRQQQLDEATTAAHDVGMSFSCCYESFMRMIYVCVCGLTVSNSPAPYCHEQRVWGCAIGMSLATAHASILQPIHSQALQQC